MEVVFFLFFVTPDAFLSPLGLVFPLALSPAEATEAIPCMAVKCEGMLLATLLTQHGDGCVARVKSMHSTHGCTVGHHKCGSTVRDGKCDVTHRMRWGLPFLRHHGVTRH